MSSSLMRLALIGYALALSLTLCLLVLPSSSQAQVGFGISTGYRATPGLPTIAIALPNISGTGIGGAVGGGVSGGFGGGVGGGVAGGVGGGGVSASFSPIPLIYHINLGQFFPNNGQIIGLPPPTLMPPLNNLLYDTTGAPYATITALGLGGGVGIGGGIGGGGFGGAGAGGGIAGGGMGGFAGKGMGGFNGKKPL
jgi:hypothetical protein